MIHFLPDEFAADAATPYTEAVARLASIKTALTVAQQVAGGESAGPSGTPVPAAWPTASAARLRCFETRSVESAQAAAAGLEMIAAQRAAGTDPHPQSVSRFADVLRADIADLERLFSL